MKALVATPGTEGTLCLRDVSEPEPLEGAVLVETLAMGVCGTDHEILRGEYGEAPVDEEQLILGHESLGRVLEAPKVSGFVSGDLVVGIVRHPDPTPCRSCAAGEPDMCTNGRYTEHGIKGRHGFGRERFRLEPAFAVKVPAALGASAVLLEPASVLAKAWEHLERIGRRAIWSPARVLVTGAGPVGLLAAMMGAQRGLEVHVFDVEQTGPKPALVTALGGSYYTRDLAAAARDVDVIVECTGASSLIVELLTCRPPDSILCLAGLSSSHTISIDVGSWSERMVLGNDVVFGTVNANRRHYALALASLLRADPKWLAGLITRRAPLDQWQLAFERRAGDVKVVVDFAS